MFIMNKKILSPIAAICTVAESVLPVSKKRTFEITFVFLTPFNDICYYKLHIKFLHIL